jgi:hypothetical protein
MLKKVFGPLVFVFGLLVALTPRFILPVCEYYGKSRMVCSYTGRAEMVIGAFAVALAAAVFLAKTAEALKWLLYAVFFVGLSVFFVPSVIGYCPSSQMPCNYGTVPMLRFLGVLMATTSAVGFLMARKAPSAA